jgi:hypothetical protein
LVFNLASVGLRLFLHIPSFTCLLTAKPLLSMRTVGSNDVERRVKPLKLTMLTKKRNRLQDPKGICLFCASENLRYIMTAKNILGNWKERY